MYEIMVSRPLGLLSGVVFIWIALIVAADVTLRALGVAVTGSTEVNENLLVLAVAFGLAYTEARDSNIGVEIFTQLLSARSQRYCVVVTKIISLGVSLLLVWGLFGAALNSYQIGEYKFSSFNVPLWPAKFGVALGFVALSIELGVQLWRVCAGLVPPRAESNAADTAL